MGLNKRNPNILDREFDMPGWDKSVGVTDMYYENVVRNHYKLIQAHLGNYQIDRMAKNRNFGKDTADWTFVMKRYLKDSLGHQTTFGDQVFNIMNPVTGKNEKVSDIWYFIPNYLSIRIKIICLFRIIYYCLFYSK